MFLQESCDGTVNSSIDNRLLSTNICTVTRGRDGGKRAYRPRGCGQRLTVSRLPCRGVCTKKVAHGLRVPGGDLCRRQKQRPSRQARPGSRERQARPRPLQFSILNSQFPVPCSLFPVPCPLTKNFSKKFAKRVDKTANFGYNIKAA